jgi:hypothetical protein
MKGSRIRGIKWADRAEVRSGTKAEGRSGRRRMDEKLETGNE